MDLILGESLLMHFKSRLSFHGKPCYPMGGKVGMDTSNNMPHPPEFESPSVASNADAMDKVTDRYDINPPGRPLITDAMDQITGISDLVLPNSEPLCVETHEPGTEDAELCVETGTSPKDGETLSLKAELCVETIKIKPCSVKLVSLESILFPTPQPTHSTNSQNVPAVPNQAPSTPAVPLPPPPLVIADTPLTAKTSTSSAPDDHVEGTTAQETDKAKKSSKSRKYGCRMCEVREETAQELKDHHSKSHGIMYCSECTKAFNNQLSLKRHQYKHKARPYVCNTCGEDFPFESQYKTHRLTHSTCRKHACTFSNCDKCFKNVGNWNRHIKEHTSSWLKCPDCPDYKTKAKRDFESHRLKH